MVILPVLVPNYAQLPSLTSGRAPCRESPDQPPAVGTAEVTKEEVKAAVALGLLVGEQTKLPVIAAMVLGWGEASAGEFVGFSAVKEQMAYMLAEQVSMVLWNCVQATDDLEIGLE
jgi:hypothetical protein